MIPGGGLSRIRDRWIGCRPGFFLPVRVLSRLFRRVFLEMLNHAYQTGKLQFFSSLEALADPKAFARYLAPAREYEWVVYAKPPFGGPERVLEYLARYTHRVAISNHRLVAIDEHQISFRWKDYRHEHKLKIMTIAAHEFVRRFLMHVIPPGLQRIRHYGFLANASRKKALTLCRKLLLADALELLPQPAVDYRDWYEAVAGESLRRCPKCTTGTMWKIEIWAPLPASSTAGVDTS